MNDTSQTVLLRVAAFLVDALTIDCYSYTVLHTCPLANTQRCHPNRRTFEKWLRVLMSPLVFHLLSHPCRPIPI